MGHLPPFAALVYKALCVNKNGWSDLIEQLKEAGVAFAAGLTETEISRAEESYGFRFPPDLREFLQTALPTGHRFPDWRAGDDTLIRDLLRLPLEGILFDVEQNEFWLPEWGTQPTRIEDARTVVEEHVNNAPRLVPIYGHRMIPDRPNEAGNPVLSVHQTDIIYYGFDLDDFFRHEFELAGEKPWPSEVRRIDFWDVNCWQDLRWRKSSSPNQKE
jgi:hypothetical protein